MKPITIGMATYDDVAGVFFTLSTLRNFPTDYPGLDEIIVVDNNPNSKHGQRIKGACQSWGAKYVPYVEKTGTSAPRNKVFEEAKAGNFVLCIDCHIQIHPGGFDALQTYLRNERTSRNLIQGVLAYDGNRSFATQFSSEWGNGMKGRWEDNPFRKTYAYFEVQAQGLGLFGCYKEHWLGFNPRFKYFGGEEWYIHDKYRRAGRKTICISDLKWTHFFHDPSEPTKYPNKLDYRIANYLIGHLENGKDPAEIYDHFKTQYPAFCTEERMRAIDNYVLGKTEEIDPISTDAPKKKGCGGCQGSMRLPTAPQVLTVENLYEQAVRTPSDINEHVPTLKDLATGQDLVVEFGVRTGVSTIGLLAGKPKKLLSYDVNDSVQARTLVAVAKKENLDFEFNIGNSLEVVIPECDVLFIDTLHTGKQVLNELLKHHVKVRKYIAFHDTVIFGKRGEDGQAGLLTGIREFMKRHPEWHTIRHDNNNHGFTVISRLESDKPPELPAMWRMAVTYGKSELKDALNGRKRVPLEVAQERHNICTSNGGACPAKQRNIDTDRCTECGCWLWEQLDDNGNSLGEQTGKVWRPLDSCPLGYWPVYASFDQATAKEVSEEMKGGA